MTHQFWKAGFMFVQVPTNSGEIRGARDAVSGFGLGEEHAVRICSATASTKNVAAGGGEHPLQKHPLIADLVFSLVSSKRILRRRDWVARAASALQRTECE